MSGFERHLDAAADQAKSALQGSGVYVVGDITDNAFFDRVVATAVEADGGIDGIGRG